MITPLIFLFLVTALAGLIIEVIDHIHRAA